MVDEQSGVIVVALKGGENVQQASKWVKCFICQGLHRSKDYPKRDKVFALQRESDSESGDLETRLNPIQHLPHAKFH